LIVAPLLAQNPTGTLTGRVFHEGAALPGVTVTADSPALQGQKVALTGVNGDYIFRFLPAGRYTIRFALDGFATLEMPVVVAAAQSRTVDAEMYARALEEEIVVTGEYDTVSVGTQSNITLQQDLVEQLPVARDLNNSVLLTPGTSSTGPNDGITISGAQSHENLFLINGVVTNENVRGQSFDLFIEDAIQETTTTTSGVSAEYGRFAGGVVNMLTKSGGNEFSGSFRTNLSNDSWQDETPLTTDQADEINQVYEATLGGYILRDKLWFFLAGRDRTNDESRQLYDQTPYNYTDTQTRYEGKLTWSMHPNHRLIGSYMEIDSEQGPYDFFTALEPRAQSPARQLPQDLFSLNYTGVVTENFFLEAQYAERNFTFENSGGTADPGDRINGTVIYFYYSNAQANSDVFCGKCSPEERNMDNLLAKASWFLSSESMGTHDLVFGFDTYNDVRLSNNYQSPSNFFIWNYNDPTYGPDGTFYPVFTGGEDLDYWPIFLTSNGTDFTTNSFYVNDTWRLNSNLTINLGIRYDQNDGQDGAGKTVADDDRFSPRLGASWDINGDGEWVVNASVARYVTAIANSVGDSGGGGNPSYFGYTYGGPLINTDGTNVCGPDHPELCEYTSPEAMEIVFDWFDSVGGLGNTDLWYASPSISGVNDVVENLSSPYTDEYTIGLTKRLGNKGLVRIDYVHREGHDFYAIQRDLTTGTIAFEEEVIPGVIISQDFDLGITYNEDDLAKREYDGLHTSIQYRFNDKIQVGGSYTLSNATGNFNGETGGSGPVRFTGMNYPEYQRAEWSYPEGDLSIDQRHRVRAWLVWDILSTSRWNLSASWLENFWTGTPYGANGSVVVAGSAEWFIPNPGYESPPNYVDYWFTSRDAFRTDDIHRSDLSFNLSFFVGNQVEIFLQPEILNIFGEDGVTNPNTGVLTWRNSDLETFDPYTTTPVQGTHWDYGSSFGEADTEDDFQTPRTYRLSLGVRF